MDGFLSGASYVDWFGDQHMSLFQTQFNQDHYSDGLIHSIGEGYRAFIEKANVKRKSEFLAGRYCAHRALEAFDVAPELIGIGQGRSPVWPDGVVGSISHCDGYAIAAAAGKDSLLSVGIDVEDIVSPEIQQTLSKSIINDDELFLLNQDAPAELVFTMIFSAKESFFKAVYPFVKAYFGFEAMSVTGIDWRGERLAFRANADLGGAVLLGTMLTARFKLLDRRMLTCFNMGRDDDSFERLVRQPG
ncbi:4'-phosphopantetheinyl transferase family protein [Rhizobium skierniewicense]|uniref:4'-phosphopantetheinyl transferase family protein n=1 Tax=Rhizobium skierniewicense TaxID=984260 RepID=UPI001572DE79|nr:4'-phosphopantetheinyl transferase superfamily protein [Rhizobium skierniewicense]NTF35018.1 4'-phosphopantetheinyl transferase superfamily protein [Rhizobium skierniewicense]